MIISRRCTEYVVLVAQLPNIHTRLDSQMFIQMRFLWAYFSFGGGDRVTFSYSTLLSSMADGLCLVVSTDAIIRNIPSRVFF